MSNDNETEREARNRMTPEEMCKSQTEGRQRVNREKERRTARAESYRLKIENAALRRKIFELEDKLVEATRPQVEESE